jgi:putative DNA primase/helicase
MKKADTTFISFFPNCKYRYLDLSGANKVPVSSDTIREDLNKSGYDSFFTPNGFKGENATKENCINLSAFYIDIDKKLNEKEIEEIKKILNPTFITETFNGFHFYWCLDEIIYKDEVENWNELISEWEKIEQSIVDTIKNADKQVKDIPRILRVPNTVYWKKTKGEFKIKGYYKSPSSVYSMNQILEAFPIKEEVITYSSPIVHTEKLQKYAEDERKDFYNKVNVRYPIEERPSFQRLITGKPETLSKGEGQRNHALLVVSSLMKQAGWSKTKAIKHFNEIGWHGIEKERGGPQEIANTVNSAFNNTYTYSYKNEIISHNMTEEEQQHIQEAFIGALKDRKEKDKTRFATYEREILSRLPYIRKNAIGIIYNYKDGVYREISDQDLASIFFNGLYEDMLWNYRTSKNVSDKIKCLISIIPNLDITYDGGYILNLKNGLLNIKTRKLEPHTPNFVSLIQSPVSYDPDAQCPVWNDCIEAWMAGDESDQKKLLLQQFAGYCLSSSMLHDRALFLVGDGGNGKSTFVDTISMVLGKDSTSHIDLESLYSNFGMAGLIGKRLNVIEEVHGNYYQSNKLKKLISGENVTIDIKYKPQYTFRPQAKFIFSVNQMPRVDDTSTATERRMCVILFKNNFRINPNVELRSELGTLAQELPGVLNWMLKGADILREKKNFIVTREQTQVLSEYRQENSSVEGFIGECLEFIEGGIISTTDLYEMYKTFCVKDGRKSKSNIGFTKEVKAYGARHEVFQFVDRANGHDPSRFEGMQLREDSGVYKNSLHGF